MKFLVCNNDTVLCEDCHYELSEDGDLHEVDDLVVATVEVGECRACGSSVTNVTDNPE